MNENKLNALIKDIKDVFPQQDPLVILYGSAVYGKVDSDYDLCVIVHHFTDESIKVLKDIVVNFHINNLLQLDHEVPFENKLLYTYKDVHQVIRFSPFDVISNNFVIREVKKDALFLNSHHIKNRLLFFSLTSDSKVLSGNNQVFNAYKDEAFKTLIKSVYAYTYNYTMTLDEFIEVLCRDCYSGNEGELFLGYKRENPFLVEYLRRRTKAYFSLFQESGEMLQKGGAFCFKDGVIDNFKYCVYNNPCKKPIVDNFPKYHKMLFHDFAENSNPLGPSKELSENIRFFSTYLNVYPDHKNIKINKMLSNFLGTTERNTAACNGSIEAIFAIPQIRDSSRPGIIQPTYWAFEAIMERLSRKVKKIPFKRENNLQFDKNDIETLAKNCSMIYLCNPNNPTSSFISPDVLFEIIKKYPECHFIIDESHILLKHHHLQYSLLQYIDNFTKQENLSLVYCLSKMFAVAALRIGAIVSNSKLIEDFKNWQVPYSLNTLAQAFFPIALQDHEFITTTRDKIHILRNELLSMLSSISWIKTIPSSTNFILCEVMDKMTATELAQRLEEDGFYIRELTSHYPGIPGEWIRISVNNSFLNKKLIEVMKCY